MLPPIVFFVLFLPMLFQFALRLVCGISLMLGLMPRQHVRSGFFRVQMLVLLGLSVVATLAAEDRVQPKSLNAASPAASDGRDQAETWLSPVPAYACAGVAGLAFLGSILWTLERRQAGSVVLWAIVGLAFATLALATTLRGPIAPFRLALWSELASSALLGGAMTAMLLGHSYLTAPSMSLRPLQRLNTFFGVSVVLRGLVAGVCLALVWQQVSSETSLLWLALRWLAGIVGPLVMYGMVVQILKYRNTQAATGVLYAAVILTFIGELTATLLARDLQFPI